MIYLALAVTCNLLIGVTLKHAALTRIDRVQLLTINYVAAASVALAVLWARHDLSAISAMWSPGLVALSVVTGALFIGGFFLFSYATEIAGMSLAITAMRISIAIPFAASWFIWNEVPGSGKLVGMFVACCALVLVTLEPGVRPRWGWTGVLGALFVSGGLVDISFKAFNELYGASADSGTFMLIVFGVAFLIGAVAMLVRADAPPDRRTVKWGLWLGIINYGSVIFLLKAVSLIPGTILFPTNGVLIVIGGAVIGIGVFKERLSRLQFAGLALAGIAIFLLNR